MNTVLRTIGSTILCFCFSLNAKAQVEGVDQILTKVGVLYKSSENYTVAMKYEMYRGLTGTNITESYSGTMTKQGDLFHYVLLGAEIIQSPLEKVVIDANQKVIAYSKVTAQGQAASVPGDVNSLLEYYKASSSRIEGDNLICELVSKNAIDQLPYGKIIVTIDKNNYMLKQQELFFSRQLPFVEENNTVSDFGRLIITMSPMEKKKINTTYKISDYLEKVDGKIVKPTAKYSSYQFIDQSKQN